jgi:hypothetical protein
MRLFLINNFSGKFLNGLVTCTARRVEHFLDPDPIECGSTGHRRKTPFLRDAALSCLLVQMKEELNQQIPLLINRQIIGPIVLFP